MPHKLDFIPVLEVHTDAGGTQERSGVGLSGELSSCWTRQAHVTGKRSAAVHSSLKRTVDFSVGETPLYT